MYDNAKLTNLNFSIVVAAKRKDRTVSTGMRFEQCTEFN